MAGGLQLGQQRCAQLDRVAGAGHRGRDRLGAEVGIAAPRGELKEGGDGAELVWRVAEGDAVSTTLVVDGVELGLLELALARDLAVMASDQARHTLARYSARGAVRSRDIGLASARPQRRICIWSDSVPSYGPSEQPRLAAFLMENSA
jgi:hypothetical protein